jgi:hypothetical protein
VRRAAPLQADQRARQLGEELRHLNPLQTPHKRHTRLILHAMHLENVLRHIELDPVCASLAHGRSRSAGSNHHRPAWHSDAARGRPPHQPGYAVSQSARNRIEEAFAWTKTIAGCAKTKLRGTHRVAFRFTFAVAAYNLIRMPRLLAHAA